MNDKKLGDLLLAIAIILIVILMLIILVSPVFAWGGVTHEYLAFRVCNDFNCECYNETMNGSTMPDKLFFDNSNHVNYNPGTCRKSDFYTCPTEFNPASLNRTADYLQQAKIQNGCQQWETIGIASNYFFDSKEIFHQVYDGGTCQSRFEENVDNAILANQQDWVEIACGESVTSLDMEVWIDEFESKLDFLQPKKVAEPEQQDDGWIIKIVLAAFFFLVAALIYFLL